MLHYSTLRKLKKVCKHTWSVETEEGYQQCTNCGVKQYVHKWKERNSVIHYKGKTLTGYTYVFQCEHYKQLKKEKITI